MEHVVAADRHEISLRQSASRTTNQECTLKLSPQKKKTDSGWFPNNTCITSWLQRGKSRHRAPTKGRTPLSPSQPHLPRPPGKPKKDRKTQFVVPIIKPKPACTSECIVPLVLHSCRCRCGCRISRCWCTCKCQSNCDCVGVGLCLLAVSHIGLSVSNSFRVYCISLTMYFLMSLLICSLVHVCVLLTWLSRGRLE